MQTFLPYQSFAKSASVLDMRRLGKQRGEAKQIMLAILNPEYGWQHHPAVTMWRGYVNALAVYGWAVCEEWKQRGYRDNTQQFFIDHFKGGRVKYPEWLTPTFCRAHRSNLLSKAPEHYRQYWPKLPDNIPYIWPTN